MRKKKKKIRNLGITREGDTRSISILVFRVNDLLTQLLRPIKTNKKLPAVSSSVKGEKQINSPLH